jgi:hypothetical protein
MVSQSNMLKLQNPEVFEWKVVKAKVKGKKKNFKSTFDYLLSKYVNQTTESRDWSSKGSATPSLKQDRSRSHRSSYASNVIKIGSMDVTINDQVNNKILDHGLVAMTLKSRGQREGAKTIKGGQQEEESTSKATPNHQKRMEV